MKYFYYCNSMYQIINVLNINWHKRFFDENKDNYEYADIMILNGFDKAEEIASIISNSDDFRNVYLVGRVINKGHFHLFNTIIDIFLPKQYIQNKLGLKVDDIINSYDVIMVPRFSRNAASVWQINKNAILELHEDGLGTYTSTVDLNSFSKAYKILYKTMNYNRDFSDYEYININKPDLLVSKSKVKKIPSFDKKCLEKISPFFEKNINITKSEKECSCYFFYQYGLERTMEKIVRELSDRYGNSIVYCPHPRHKKEIPNNFKVELNNQMWEIRIPKIENIEKKYLISVHSTACFTPKILYDYEPYVILLYKLIEEDDINNLREDEKKFLKTFDNFIKLFKKTYKDETKIIIPKSYDELYKYLSLNNIQ